MILNDAEIKSLSNKSPGLIFPFDEKNNLRLSSYDLTVGDEYYIGQSDGAFPFETQMLRASQSITIPPHAVCFILTAENIHLPRNVTARVSLRMTHIYAGMVLTSQPPFDPTYNGKVVVMLHNLSSAPYHLKCGERVATIEFTRLTAASIGNRAHRSVGSLEAQLSKPLVSSLTEIANVSKAVQEKLTWLSGQMLVFAALVVAVLAVPGFFSYSSLLDRIGEQRDQIKDMNKTLADYKLEFEKNNTTTIELKQQLAALQSSKSTAESNVVAPQVSIKGRRQ
ncbi:MULTISPECIES: hypothetical protein [Pseudomonas]|uniref:Deoxycytidine triphosphate deaminase n=1 Tax=Pseudomonas palleroniana TaxID=191390 RepID=A0A1H5KN68_9PSED|nr:MULTISPECIES: hypothetical protein [Pseudomonas]KAB0568430.1 hypothetical protein F7R03_07495 [Pseudomonas palleroniana]PTC28735.1 hypothetical protein C9383_09345 [Pseudomonas palleroniana]SEE66213.1 deoxycytidine triphosphate deaminase [Pseudomonas palleroniana]